MRITRQTNPHRVARFAGAAALALTALALTACDEESAHPALDDVDRGWTCVAEPGLVHSSGTVTNHSSKTSFYVIEIAFRLDGKAALNRSTTIDGVEPGQTVRVEASATGASNGEVRCDITSVERFKA